MDSDSSQLSPSPDFSERDSSVGIHFEVAVELRRRRGLITDVWEARLTTLAIGIVAGVVVLYALVQVFLLLGHLFSGA